MKRTSSFVVATLLSIAIAVPSAANMDAQGRGRGQGQAAKAGKAEKPDRRGKPAAEADRSGKKAGRPHAKRDRDVDAVVVDRAGHARVIRAHRGTGSLPPGLAKRESLPPGLRRQLVERGELPSGLQRYLVDVPGSWQARLPAVPAHYHRYFAGDDLIVVDSRTNRIAAVIRDVLR